MKKSKDSFFSFILLSLGFHGIILAFLTLKILFFPGEIPEHIDAIRVDVVALPEKQTTPPPPAPEKPEPKKSEPKKPKPEPKKPKPKKPEPKKPKPKPKPKQPDVKKVLDEQDSAITRLKALQKLKEKNKEKDDPIQKIEYKGNQLSKGNSLTGMQTLKDNNYTDKLQPHIKAYWSLPEWLANANLNALVLIKIDKRGGVISKTFLSKSGNENFDEYVMGTIEKAIPLPPPPQSLVDLYQTRGVKIAFP